MNHLIRRSAMLLAMLVAVAACAPAPAPSGPSEASRASTEVQQRTPRGTLRIGYAAEPQTLASKFLTGGGAGEFAWIFNSTLVFFDVNGQPHPLIASQIPTRDNGDWVVNPDGTMRTTYRLRPNARWHDGAPLTARDFVFAWQAYLDPDQPAVSRAPESLMSSVEATDDQTLVISWKQPYRLANTLGYQQLNPLPRHLLEEKLRANRANFAVGEEWNKAYVGSGPFRVQSWEPGSRLIAQAHNRGSLMDPEVDRLHRAWTNSLDQNERNQALVALNRRMTDQLGFGPLYYSAEVILAKTSVRGPVGNYAGQIGVTWNIHEWEIATP